MEYFKDFKNWGKVKIKLEKDSHIPALFNEGDIWWTSIGVNLGTEICGKGRNFTRPVLVIKKYNKYSFLGIPLSTKLYSQNYYIPILVNRERQSCVLSQAKVFSSLRIENRITEISKEDLKRIIRKFKKTF
ncbi:type II toxin-antitoxin system PemK/MazF family toxin [Candidatus Dojkabacteria bacterium]|jgi:mRNA interferase MazF|nr:type II toxin-antitoxin system PemK/MazF family toxin [Candidatus Dojkabacteria bacterium]